MNANGRRYRRYRICVPVSLVIGKQTFSLETGDLGMSGVFVRTDAHPKANEFVRLTIDLPFGGGLLALLGRVTYVRRPGDPDRAPGLGVAFYGNGPTERDAWQKFVREIERRHPESVEREIVLTSAALPVDPVRRRFQRFEVVVQVKAYFESVDELIEMHTRDISQGGMFIASTIVTAEGERLTLRVVHPETEAEFPIPCVVRRCVNEANRRGLAVEFQLDEAGRNSFWSFIGAVVMAQMERL
jgi:Tfp pilus assembly protein PilZ